MTSFFAHKQRLYYTLADKKKPQSYDSEAKLSAKFLLKEAYFLIILVETVLPFNR